MSSRLESLRERRLAIVAECDGDRTGVAQAWGGIQRELHVADRVMAVAQRFKEHRAMMGVVATALVLAPVFARKWIRRAAWWLPVAIQGYRIIKQSRQSSRTKRRTRRRSDDDSTSE